MTPQSLWRTCCIALTLFIAPAFMPAFMQNAQAKEPQAGASAAAAQTVPAHRTQTVSWRTAYKKFLRHPKRNIRKIYDDRYIRGWFGSRYRLTKYFLYDLNKDGIPELFLYMPKEKNIGYVLTCRKGEVRYVWFAQIAGVKRGYVLQRRSWHGGGSVKYAWQGVNIHFTSGCSGKYFYIDYFPDNNGCIRKGCYLRSGTRRNTYKKDHVSRSMYRKYYRKYVRHRRSLSSRFKRGTSVSDPRPIEQYP